MGGRGASSSIATGRGGGIAVKSITTQDGQTIDLSEYPLKYGKDDPALTGAKRQTIENFEDRHKNAKIEYNILLDENGNVLAENKGGRSSVKAKISDREKTEVLSHNHPRGKGEEGLLGGTFSEGDLTNFTTYGKTKTYRASAYEGTYSITKGKNFDAKGFMDYVKKSEKDNMNNYTSKVKKLGEDYKNGKYGKATDYSSYQKYIKDYNQEFNRYLVNSHNNLLNAQKKYDYTYTLERKK